jgi:glycosyltransferase involved in cell wall biosynthesis
VTVAGFRENPFPWYANAAACVLSSDREGMPNVLIESLICGTPVVSTDCPSGPREVLIGELSRWLVPSGDAAALAQKMREVIEVPPKIDAAILERFSKEQAINAIEELARTV